MRFCLPTDEEKERAVSFGYILSRWRNVESVAYLGFPKSESLSLDIPRPAIYPYNFHGHWHLVVTYHHDFVMTVEPEWWENLDRWFRRNLADPESYYWIPEAWEPAEEHPYKDKGVAKDAPKAKMYVYFVQGGRRGLIKIGTSNSPSTRVDSFRTFSPVSLNLLATIAGGHKAESALHRRFAHLRQHGEWFKPAPELLEFIRACAERVV